MDDNNWEKACFTCFHSFPPLMGIRPFEKAAGTERAADFQHCALEDLGIALDPDRIQSASVLGICSSLAEMLSAGEAGHLHTTLGSGISGDACRGSTGQRAGHRQEMGPASLLCSLSVCLL